MSLTATKFIKKKYMKIIHGKQKNIKTHVKPDGAFCSIPSNDAHWQHTFKSLLVAEDLLFLLTI